jgi:antirestriction protein ArdC
MKTDLYQRVTDQIVASLEQGVRPWMKPWSAEHVAGRITFCAQTGFPIRVSNFRCCGPMR